MQRERRGERGVTRFSDPDCPAKEREDVSAEEKHKHGLLLQLRLEFIRLIFRPNHQNKSCLTEQTEQSAEHGPTRRSHLLEQILENKVQRRPSGFYCEKHTARARHPQVVHT